MAIAEPTPPVDEPDAAAAAPPPWWQRLSRPAMATVAGGAAVVIAGSAWALWPDSLAESDPAGYRACQLVRDYQTGASSEGRLITSMAVADLALKSSTESIHKLAAPDVVGDLRNDTPGSATSRLPVLNLIDIAKVRDACDDAGVDMPKWVKEPQEK